MGRVCHLLDGNHLSRTYSDFPIVKPVQCKTCQNLFVMILPMEHDIRIWCFRMSFAPTWDEPSKSRQIAALGGNNIIRQFLKITSAPTKQRLKNDNPNGWRKTTFVRQHHGKWPSGLHFPAYLCWRSWWSAEECPSVHCNIPRAALLGGEPLFPSSGPAD